MDRNVDGVLDRDVDRIVGRIGVREFSGGLFFATPPQGRKLTGDFLYNMVG